MIPSTNSKFQVQTNPNVSKINSILARPVLKNKNLIKSMVIEPSKILTDDLFKYSNFSVDEDGYYSISSQLSLQVSKKTNIKFLQFGVCSDDLTDFAVSFNSFVIDGSVEQFVLSHNLATTKFLEKDKNYCAWCFVSSSNNKNIEFCNDYSSVLLLKISD